MRLPTFTPSATAQAVGMGVGVATALYGTYRFGFCYPLFFVGWIAAWVRWELAAGARIAAATAHRGDAAILAYAFFSGVAFPWLGCALTALAALARP